MKRKNMPHRKERRKRRAAEREKQRKLDNIQRKMAEADSLRLRLATAGIFDDEPDANLQND